MTSFARFDCGYYHEDPLGNVSLHCDDPSQHAQFNPAADPAPRWGRCPNCGVEHTGDDCMEGKHRHVPDPYMLAGIEAHHVESTETPGWCANAGCGQGWPCVPKKMADEVRRLTAALDAMTGGAAVEAVAKALASHYGDVGYAALHEGDASVAVEAIRALGGAS